jgi:hypothetical protein
MPQVFLRLRRRLLYWFAKRLGDVADPYVVVRNSLLNGPQLEEGLDAFDKRDLGLAFERFSHTAEQGSASPHFSNK